MNRRKLPRIPIKARELFLAENDKKKGVIKEITYADIDIDGRREKIWGYVIKDLAWDIIPRKP